MRDVYINKLICHKGQRQSDSTTIRASKEISYKQVVHNNICRLQETKTILLTNVMKNRNIIYKSVGFKLLYRDAPFFPSINSSHRCALIKFISGLDPNPRSQKQIVDLTIGKLSHYQQLSG